MLIHELTETIKNNPQGLITDYADYIRVTDELIQAGYTFHHTATRAGYVKRKGLYGIIEPYHGRFGYGFIIRKPSNAKQVSHIIEYYVRTPQ